MTVEKDPVIPETTTSKRYARRKYSPHLRAMPHARLALWPYAVLQGYGTESIQQWLESYDLGMLLPHFTENEVEWADLFVLTKTDLKDELGISKLAHRKLLSEALDDLREHVGSPPRSPRQDGPLVCAAR